jgi:hypothetical protein
MRGRGNLIEQFGWYVLILVKEAGWWAIWSRLCGALSCCNVKCQSTSVLTATVSSYKEKRTCAFACKRDERLPAICQQ